ncbi:colicin [Flavobacterium sp. CSZ]|uniref:colicin n=1 Tax=Flavobacterium sp. CSZ TaxID=2783791 RepID=UPI00188BA2CE|nr:colicin [Flavobacterium sp. CSZ]MBF4483808.1 colicin [Flavobacterium sp. CSZ]
MEYKELRRNVLLSIQRALLGMIYPEIRAIAVGFEGLGKLTVIYYLDREPNNDDFENISDVTAEVLGDINFSEVEEKCFFSDEIITKLDNLDLWVYIRKEN